VRRKAGELPFKFTLDDAMAMSPATRLSTAPMVIVGARISRSGEATPRAGDLQGASAAVKNGAQGVNVVIDTEVQ
jgi:cytochrome c-type biogenesis protein CcmH